MRYRVWKGMFLLFCLAVFATAFPEILKDRAKASVLAGDFYREEVFREQALPPSLYERIRKQASTPAAFGDLMTATMLNGRFAPTGLSGDGEPYLQYKKEEFYRLRGIYQALWCETACFPVAGEDISYENTFGAPRTYGGERSHEGTDLFGRCTIPGYYPVLSMTDGVVEKIGWLPLGGYRIGIRAPGGAYFYYAHLSGYEQEFTVGESVAAGDILGYMGNTGYGEEGTKGKFPVHLHLGIYIETPYTEELSVNPYWILKTSEKNMRKYAYS